MNSRRFFTLAAALLLCAIGLNAQTRFTYKGKQMVSGRNTLYVDAARKTNAAKYTFRNVTEALRHAEAHNGDAEWTEIYIQPSVYWVENPDDDSVRRPAPGENAPFGMKVKMDRVRMIGMGNRAEDVVIASNRGQTQGADGNYTMFHITGSDIEAENITFGNYCNVDLVYDLNKKLSHKRRKDAIVQAQLVICRGDRYRLTNCRFISRLNLCPFVGAPHTEFQNCYFECTDDALCGTGTYRNCEFTLFSSKPFYTTQGEGAKFYDCRLHCKATGVQYLTKVSGPVQMERCAFTSDDPNLRIEWNKRPDPRHYCVMKDCTLNGKALNVPTPTEPLSRVLPAIPVQVQKDIIPGRWTMDCYKPADTAEYPWKADNTRSSWGWAEGVDGGEGKWGLVQLQKGARLMLTPAQGLEPTDKQVCTVEMDPCKAPGQGFGSATGQYLDICIKFDTKTLTGYGLRFIRTPDYDHAVEVYLVEYANGNISRISEPQRCDLFKPTCRVTLTAEGSRLTALIEHEQDGTNLTQNLEAVMPNPNTFAGFHLQHTGSIGASATVIKSIFLKP